MTVAFFHFRSGDGQYVILEDTLSDVSDWSSSLVSKAQQQVYATAHVTRCVQTGGEVFPVSEIKLKIDNSKQYRMSMCKPVFLPTWLSLDI